MLTWKLQQANVLKEFGKVNVKLMCSCFVLESVIPLRNITRKTHIHREGLPKDEIVDDCTALSFQMFIWSATFLQGVGCCGEGLFLAVNYLKEMLHWSHWSIIWYFSLKNMSIILSIYGKFIVTMLDVTG